MQRDDKGRLFLAADVEVVKSLRSETGTAMQDGAKTVAADRPSRWRASRDLAIPMAIHDDWFSVKQRRLIGDIPLMLEMLGFYQLSERKGDAGRPSRL